MDLRMYILVNKDIEINKGKLAGQVGHAVAVYFYQNRANKILDDYMNKFQKKIILYETEENLLSLEEKGYITIRDKGWTDLEPNTLTCVNLGIIDYNNIPKDINFINNLKLVR